MTNPFANLSGKLQKFAETIKSQASVFETKKVAYEGRNDKLLNSVASSMMKNVIKANK